MITQIFSDSTVQKFCGLSTDIKPLDVTNASIFTEIDTGKIYLYDSDNNSWRLKKSTSNIDLRQAVVDILTEYGLIKLEELTAKQIEAIQNMTAEINENGELILNYDTSVLDLDFSIVDKDLIVESNINVDFEINNNGELEADY